MDRLCVDIDNVLAQTDEVMRRVIREYTGGRVKLEYTHIQEFNYYECKDESGCSITKEDWQVIHELFSERETLLGIKPFPFAQGCLKKLAGRYTLHLATSRLPKARKATIEWLETNCFPAHDLHFLKHGEKHVTLGNFKAAVEDHYEQAVGFARSGTPCYLIRHPWNATKQPTDNLHWVDGWLELVERLLA